MLSLFLILFYFPAYFCNKEKVYQAELNGTYDVEDSSFFTRLLNGYRFDEAPLENGATAVTFALYIHHLSIPDIPNPTVRFNSFLHTQWSDERLGWNAADENGRQRALLPPGHTIWTPRIHAFIKGYSSRMSVQAFKTTRTYLTVTEKNRFQSARVNMLHRYDGSFDCNVSGSFPFETLHCSALFYSALPISQVVLKVQDTEMELKKIDMNDIGTPTINGWKVLTATQRTRYYDPLIENGTNIKDDIDGDDYPFLIRSLVQCKVVVRREGWTLFLVVLTPILLVSLLITGSCIVPLRWSPAVLVAVIYILTSIVRDSLERSTVYADVLPGIDMIVIYLWISSLLSMISHSLTIHFHRSTFSKAHRLSAMFKVLPIYSRIEAIVLSKTEDAEFTPFGLDFARTLAGLLFLLTTAVFFFVN